MNSENTLFCVNGPDCQVLMVEDDRMLKLVTGISLEAAGILFCSASSGEEFLDILRLHNPRLIILDVVMPGLNGFDIVDRIKKEPDFAAHRNVKALVHTSRDLTIEERKRLTLGTTIIYTKTTCDDIALVVRQLLEQNQL